MITTAHRARTALAIGAAGAALIAALIAAFVMTQGDRCAVRASSMLSASLASTEILPGDRDQAIAVAISAPGIARTRAPLSLAVVIDRSGSMNGTPMENAKAAAADLVDRLSPDDAFTIIAFSSGAETVMPIRRAMPANKAAARDAISRIRADGGTCISCGLTRAESELVRSPASRGVRRIVLISDGQANEGISDRGELADLASATASHGDSISTIGVGLEFDELTMIHLAEVARGNYYFVENTTHLSAMLARELAGLSETAATDVRLVVTPAATTTIDRAYGYPVTHAGQAIVIPIADLRAGERLDLVMPAQIAASATGELPVASFALAWRDPIDGSAHHAEADLATQVVDDATAVAASIDRDAVRAIAQARSAQILDDATLTYEHQGSRAAQQVLEHHMRVLRADKNLDDATLQTIDQAVQHAIDGFAAAPAGDGTAAKKVTRTRAYDLLH